jgi:hypothetical protein
LENNNKNDTSTTICEQKTTNKRDRNLHNTLKHIIINEQAAYCADLVRTDNMAVISSMLNNSFLVIANNSLAWFVGCSLMNLCHDNVITVYLQSESISVFVH